MWKLGVCGKSMYLSCNFVVNIKCTKIVFNKKKKSIHEYNKKPLLFVYRLCDIFCIGCCVEMSVHFSRINA